jgi:phosphoribosyl 1,2-cyclic phosphate phosphodiesterase
MERLRVRRGYFTHIAHELGHEDTNAQLPPNLRLAYDGLQVEV